MRDVELEQEQITEDAVRNADSQSDSLYELFHESTGQRVLLMDKNELEAFLSEILVKQRKNDFGMER